MTNEEIQEIVAKADDEYDRLKDRVHEQYDEIKRLKEDYMILQNASDKVEEEKDKEIERLNNIINEFDDFITNVDSHINLGDESEEFILVRDKWLELQELKGVDKE